jgi:hypothetical protein
MLQRLFPGTVEAMRLRARQVLFFAAAGVALLIALIYLMGAAHSFLAVRYSAQTASLLLALVATTIAIVLFLIALWIGRKLERPAVDPARSSLVNSVAENLARTGFRREGLILRAAAEVTRTLRPLHYVSLSILAGFVFGRRLNRD